MKISGNGAIETCANNLLKIVQGEVPFSREKGVNTEAIDQPITENALPEEAEDMLLEYEPRFESAEAILRLIGGDGTLTYDGMIMEDEEDDN